MNILTTIPNGASLADIRATLNSALARILALESAVTVTPTPTPTPTPAFTVQPSITGTARSGQTLTGVDGTITDGTVTVRQWLRGTSAISGANGATYVVTDADVGMTLAYRVTAAGAGGSTPATSANTAVVSSAPTPTPTPGADTFDATLKAPTLALAVPAGQFPPKLSYIQDDTFVAGTDSFQLQTATDYAFTNLLINYTATPTLAQVQSGTLSDTGLSAINSGGTFSRMRGKRPDGRYSLWSSVVAHGDTVAPTIAASGTSATTAEQLLMAMTITANELSYFALGGGDAGALELVGAQPATSIGVRLAGNAPLDYETKAGYAFTITATDLAGNVGAAVACTQTVINKDEVPDAFTFAKAQNAALSSTIQSGPITIGGLDAGTTTPISVTGGQYRKNGGAATNATGTGINGDIIIAVAATSATASEANVKVNIGGNIGVFTVQTVGYAGPTTWGTTVPAENTKSNADRTITNVTPFGSEAPRGVAEAVTATSGKFRAEWRVDALGYAGAGSRTQLGLGNPEFMSQFGNGSNHFGGLDSKSIAYYAGGIIGTSTGTASAPTYGEGDVITLDYRFDTGAYEWRKNGASVYAGNWLPPGGTAGPYGATDRQPTALTITADTTPPTGYTHWGN